MLSDCNKSSELDRWRRLSISVVDAVKMRIIILDSYDSIRDQFHETKYQTGFGNEFARGRRGCCPSDATRRRRRRLDCMPSSSRGRHSQCRARITSGRGHIASARASRTGHSSRSTTRVGSSQFDEPVDARTSFVGTRCRCRANRRILSTASRPSRATATLFADRHRRSHLCLQQGHGRPVFLQRRRRDADRARDGTARDTDGAWGYAGRAGIDRRDTAGIKFRVEPAPGRQAVLAVTFARITASNFACPTSGRSVRMAWQMRAILRRPSRGLRTATAVRARRKIWRESLVVRDRSFAARRRRMARQLCSLSI